MVKIIPTIFAKNKKEFETRMRKLLPIAKEFQIDFMDGKLTKQKGVSLEDIQSLKKIARSFEAHLMVKDPINWVKPLAKKGFKRFLFHIESQKSLEETKELIKAAKAEGLQVGVVLDAKTSVRKIEPIIGSVHTIMFMGHRIGVEHVKVEPQAYAKVARFHERFPRKCIEIDGGVDDKTIQKFIRAGASRVSVGSYVDRAENPAAALRTLRKLGREV